LRLVTNSKAIAVKPSKISALLFHSLIKCAVRAKRRPCGTWHSAAKKLRLQMTADLTAPWIQATVQLHVPLLFTCFHSVIML